MNTLVYILICKFYVLPWRTDLKQYDILSIDIELFKLSKTSQAGIHTDLHSHGCTMLIVF